MTWRETGILSADADCITDDDVATCVVVGAWVDVGAQYPVGVEVETGWSAARIRLTPEQADALGDAIKSAAALVRGGSK